MKKLLITFCALLFIAQDATSQQFCYTIHIADTTNGLPTTITDSSGYKLLDFTNQNIENIFNQYQITEFKKIYSLFTTPSLHHFYSIICDDSLGNLPNSLKLYDSTIYDSWRFESAVIPFSSKALKLVPNDYSSSTQSNLDLIKAEQAWDVTTGDPNISIGILDALWGGVGTHPELLNKTNILITSVPNPGAHGVLVAQAAAAETDNNFGVAGIGFNCSLVVDQLKNTNEWLDDVRKLANNGARVVNISFGLNGCTPHNYPRPDEQTCINELAEDGILIVVAAGNGPEPGGGCTETTIFYPAAYDNVLSVTSCGHQNPQIGTKTYGIKDVILQDLVDPSLNYTHTRNNMVDVVAPGYKVPLMEAVAGSNGTIDLIEATGTSFAAPQVAGLAGLIFSINPCFTPQEVTDIIKSTTVNIDNVQCTINGITYTPNLAYIGTYGTGRIDAEAAVLLADELTADGNRTLAANETWDMNRYVSGDITVPSGITLAISASTIKFDPGVKIIIQPGGFLQINNSILTTGCTDGLWGGIQAIGVFGGTQDFFTQSRVIITNSTIENAYRGIVTGDEISHLNNGGIVWATSSTFKNCRVGIAFLPNSAYTSKVPSSSYVNNCYFLCDDALLDGSGLGMLHGVSMQGVYDIGFAGNTFINSAVDGSFSDAFRGNGLTCIDCSVIVDRIYVDPGAGVPTFQQCDQPTQKRSLFQGLTTGFQVLNNFGHTDPSLRTKAIECDFINCETSTDINDDIGTVLYGNTYIWDENFIGYNQYSYKLSTAFGNQPSTVGIFLDGTESYLVENNALTFESGYQKTYGVSTIMNNSETNASNGLANFIRNTSTNISNSSFPNRTIFGNLLLENNRNLYIQCNEYCDNSYDWYLENNPALLDLFTPPHTTSVSLYNKFSDHTAIPNSVVTNVYSTYQSINFSYVALPSYSPSACPFPSTLTSSPTSFNATGGGSGATSCTKAATELCAIYCQDFPQPGAEGGCPQEPGGGNDLVINQNEGDGFLDEVEMIDAIDLDEKETIKNALNKIRNGEFEILTKEELNILIYLAKENNSKYSKKIRLALQLANTVVENNQVVNNSVIKASGNNKPNSIVKEKVNVFPNPSSKELNIDFSISKNKSVSISITDITGKEVLKLLNVRDYNKGSYTLSYDISSLSDGAYLINFKSDGNIVTKKFIKIGN